MSAGPLFDRHVPQELIDLLRPNGPLGELAERAARDPSEALDLQLRGNPKTPDEGSVTLYVGLTKAFDLCGRADGRVKVRPQPTHGPVGEARDRGWTRWIPQSQLTASEFLAWADQMIDAAQAESSSKTDHEGAVQAQVSKGVDGWFRAIDRETRFAFESRVTGDSELERIRAPLNGVVGRVRESGEPWTNKGASPALKLDVLGVDDAGRLLVIEVKPGHQTGTLAWTPLQVAHYVALVRAWTNATGDAANVLNAMVAQRQELGLLEPGWRVSSRIELVPVIAVGLPVTSNAVDRRFECVHDAVRDLTPALIDGLQIWGVEPEERGGAIGLIEGKLCGASID